MMPNRQAVCAGAAAVELAAEDLDALDAAAAGVQGARYPDQLEALTNR